MLDREMTVLRVQLNHYYRVLFLLVTILSFLILVIPEEASGQEAYLDDHSLEFKYSDLFVLDSFTLTETNADLNGSMQIASFSNRFSLGDFVVTTGPLNLRSAPGLSSGIIKVFPENTVGQIVMWQNGVNVEDLLGVYVDGYYWWNVSITMQQYFPDTYTGWFSEHRLDNFYSWTFSAGDWVKTTESGVRLRSGPSQDTTALRWLSKGAVAQVIYHPENGTPGGWPVHVWWYVELAEDGQRGWVSEAYLTSTSAPVPCSLPTPEPPSGPSQGNVGVEYYFPHQSYSCSCSGSVEYQYKCSGGNQSIWYNLHGWGMSWDSPGTYSIYARIRCKDNTSIVSNWSNAKTITITGGQDQPSDDPEPIETSTKLYGSFNDALYRYNGSVWESQAVAHAPATALTVFSGKLYGAFYDGVYVYDSSAWSTSRITPGVATAMVSYNGNLYASFADATYRYNGGSSWSKFTWPTTALASFNGYLYASFSDAIYRYDGIHWQPAPVAHAPATALAVHNGSLYAAFADGVYVFYNGAYWLPNRITPGIAYDLVSYNDKLYGSFKDLTYAWSGNEWTAFTWPTRAMAVYD